MDRQEDQDGLVGFPAPWAARAVRSAGEVAALGAELETAGRVVVIAGSSISGLVLAARLGAAGAREPGLRVVLVAGAPPVRRRLIAGCSLRFSTVRRMARALGADERGFLNRLGGEAASFRRLAVARAVPGGPQDQLVRRRTDAPNRPFVGLSTRHGWILNVLREQLAPGLPVVVVDGDVRQGCAFDGAVPLTVGGEDTALPLPAGRSVVLNATSRSDLLRPGSRLAGPDRYVIAVQAPLRTTDGTPWCGDDVGLAPMTFGPPAPHLAFFTPFFDPDTPDATWYGINTMTLSARELESVGRDEVTKVVWDRLVELEGGLGFAELDPDETRGGAVVPVVRDKATATEQALDNGSSVVDAHRAFTSGAPAINVDGMLAATVGADAFAGRFLGATGSPADAARAALAGADRALAPLRVRNWATEWAFFCAPEGVRAAAARSPRLLWRGFVTDFSRLRVRGGRGSGS